MSTDSHPAPNDGEHYVVSTVAFVQLSNIVDALNGVAALTTGRLTDAEPEISRGELAAVFRGFAQQLDAQLQALPHRPGENA